MKIIPNPITFDWDQGNIDKNLVKHNVTIKEAEEVFESQPNFVLEDVKHSLAEARYMIWGFTKNNRKLTIFFTIRESKIRIISARDMHKKERIQYDKTIQENT